MAEQVQGFDLTQIGVADQAAIDQTWAMASEGVDLLVGLLQLHYASCENGPPCGSQEFAEAVTGLLSTGPAYTAQVLHAAIHRLASAET